MRYCVVAFANGLNELGDVFAEAEEFVRGIGCPWPWLAAQLINNFRIWVQGLLCGLDVVMVVTSAPAALCGPIAPFNIHQGPDESIPAYLERFDHECAIYRQRVETVPRGAIPREPREITIVRHVTWFYLHHVHRGRFSINFIAKNSKSKRSKSGYTDRHTVRDGIRKAKRLLSLSPWTFK